MACYASKSYHAFGHRTYGVISPMGSDLPAEDVYLWRLASGVWRLTSTGFTHMLFASPAGFPRDTLHGTPVTDLIA
jgi:hypothetical protein